MATGIIRPESDITVQWYTPIMGDHYAQIDENVSWPSTPTSDYIMADGWLGGDDNQVEIFEMDDLPNVYQVTQIEIFAHGQIDNDGGAGNYPEVSYSINDGGSWSTEWNCSSFPSNDTVNVNNGAWYQKIISGLTWDQDDINNIRLRFRGDVPDGDKSTLSFNVIYCAYIRVTYSQVWTHKPIGCPAANVSRICDLQRILVKGMKGLNL